jgi:putative membrane protein
MTPRFTTIRSITALACIAALGACSGGSADNREAAGDSATAAVTPPAAEAPQAAPPPGTGSQAPVAGELSDANIAAVASASNQDEIQSSRVALEKGENAQVKQFAQRMVDDHSRMEQEMQTLLQSKGITPQDNPLSTQMKQTAQTAIQALQGMSGRQLDSAYVAHQVRSHQATLQALETMLIPNARDPQMKAMLETARPAVAQHLADAQKLQGAIR